MGNSMFKTSLTSTNADYVAAYCLDPRFKKEEIAKLINTFESGYVHTAADICGCGSICASVVG